MQAPRIEMIPLKSAVCSDAPITLDVLVRIIPPLPEVHFLRPPINLALVLDHSGSMAAGRKMEFARDAASYAVQQLLPTDRVGVTIFDDTVQTIVPNAPALDKPGIIRRIAAVQPNGSTALHDGWKEGGRQVSQHRLAGGLNRVLLLSDGLANVGLTDPGAIAAEVGSLAEGGVSTTTMGVGVDYNEDLMEAMARSGDGNYYFIESPRQLADIYQTELQGLMATLGQKLSLGVEPQQGVQVIEVLNDFDTTRAGRLMLPNLIVGMPIGVLVRLGVPPQRSGSELGQFRLAWDDPRRAGRQTLRAAPDPLPAVSKARWDALPADPVVQEHVALLRAARAKQDAALALKRGDMGTTKAMVAQSRLLASSVMSSPETEKELEDIARIEDSLERGDVGKFNKLAKFQSWLRGRGRPSS
jgi:Ca-activated chloride channel family protein